MEQQFDDLLGGFSSTSNTKETSSAPTGDLLGDFEDDTEVTVTKSTDDDGTTTVVTETRTEEAEDGGIVTETIITTTSETTQETNIGEIQTEGIDAGVREEEREELDTDIKEEETRTEVTEEPAEITTEPAEENIVNGTEGSEVRMCLHIYLLNSHLPMNLTQFIVYKIFLKLTFKEEYSSDSTESLSDFPFGQDESGVLSICTIIWKLKKSE